MPGPGVMWPLFSQRSSERKRTLSYGDRCSIRKSVLCPSVRPFHVIPGEGVGPIEVL
jgi:hypothetical protein